MITLNQTSSATDPPSPAQVIVFGGETRSALIESLRRLRTQIIRLPQTSLAELAASQLSAVPSPQLAVVAGSTESLNSLLLRAEKRLQDPQCLRIQDAAGIYFTEHPYYKPGSVAFLYPGEGAQFAGMLSGLLQRFPIVEETLKGCDRVEEQLQVRKGLLRDCLLASDQEGQHEREQQLQDFGLAIATVMSCSWCLHEILTRLGIRPDAMAGHSAGESTALFAAGAISGATPFNLIEKVVGLRGVNSTPTKMLAVGAGREKVQDLLSAAHLAPGDESKLFLAMDNCPHQIVIVGASDAVEKANSILLDANLIVQQLDLPRPYHTKLFRTFTPTLAELFQSMEFHVPKIPLYSCTTGELFPQDPTTIRDQAVKQWEQPVLFTQLIRRMYEDGIRIFIEVGPRGNLASFVEDILRGKPAVAIPANRLGKSADTQLFHLVAQLAIHHVPLEWTSLYPLKAATNAQLNPPDADQLAATDGGTSAVSEARLPTPSSALPPTVAGTHLAPRQTSAPRAFRGRIRKAIDRISTCERAVHVTGIAEGILLRQQDLMHQFLQTQQLVMQNYLQRGKSEDPSVALPPHLESDPREGSVLPPPLVDHPSSYVAPMFAPYPPVAQVTGSSLSLQRPLDLVEDLYADQHTLGGQKISRVDPSQHGQPLMPMTFFLEMVAQAAKQLCPSLVVSGIRKVHLRKWLPFYSGDPGAVEVRVHRADAGAAAADPTVVVLAEVWDLGKSRRAAMLGEAGLAAKCEVLLKPAYEKMAETERVPFDNPRACDVTIEKLYNNLFHGPSFQGVKAIHRIGDGQIECDVVVQPREDLFRSTPSPQFVLDPVTLDIVMHPLAAWHLADPDQSGRIMLPFQLDELELFGPAPQVGERMVIEGWLEHESARRFAHGLVAYREDGTAWCRMRGAKFWRFYLPFHGVNFHGPKDVYFLSDNLHDVFPTLGKRASLVRLIVPEDLMQPSLRTSGLQVVFSPREQQEFEKLNLSVEEMSTWLFSRFAVKDAARYFRLQSEGGSMFAADVEVETVSPHRFRTMPRDKLDDNPFPNVAVACVEDVYFAAGTGEDHLGFGLDCVRLQDELAAVNDTHAASLAHQLAAATGAAEELSQQQVASILRIMVSLGRDPSRLCWKQISKQQGPLRCSVESSEFEIWTTLFEGVLITLVLPASQTT